MPWLLRARAIVCHRAPPTLRAPLAEATLKLECQYLDLLLARALTWGIVRFEWVVVQFWRGVVRPEWGVVRFGRIVVRFERDTVRLGRFVVQFRWDFARLLLFLDC